MKLFFQKLIASPFPFEETIAEPADMELAIPFEEMVKNPRERLKADFVVKVSGE